MDELKVKITHLKSKKELKVPDEAMKNMKHSFWDDKQKAKAVIAPLHDALKKSGLI